MILEFLTNRIKNRKHQEAIISKGKAYTYEWVLNSIEKYRDILGSHEIQPGTVVTLEADFSHLSVSIFLALVDMGVILVPITSFKRSKKASIVRASRATVSILVNKRDQVKIRNTGQSGEHPLYEKLRRAKHPGLVLFSSGSTGKSKGIVHDFENLFEKFKRRRTSYRTLGFLHYDHIGGINTMLHTISSGGCIVTVEGRSPDTVLSAIEKHKVELLPTSPTFLNMLLISEIYKKYDLESLKRVTYGTETMAESTLKRFNELFPDIRVTQTYGLSEVGILQTKSRSSKSLWMKVGGKGVQIRVVDGVLQIRSKSTMLGYLNAPNPIMEDGWFNTGDSVDVQGEYIRILGRESQVINVGGEKVYPAEVESAIQEMDNVAAVTVYGEPNAIVGNIVCAKVGLVNRENQKRFTVRLKKHCSRYLKKHEIPVKVTVVNKKLQTERMKRVGA